MKPHIGELLFEVMQHYTDEMLHSIHRLRSIRRRSINTDVRAYEDATKQEAAIHTEAAKLYEAHLAAGHTSALVPFYQPPDRSQAAAGDMTLPAVAPTSDPPKDSKPPGPFAAQPRQGWTSSAVPTPFAPPPVALPPVTKSPPVGKRFFRKPV